MATQGEFESTCGLYSVANAFDYVVQLSANNVTRQDLVRAMVSPMPAERVKDMYFEGLTEKEVGKCVTAALTLADEEIAGLKICVKPAKTTNIQGLRSILDVALSKAHAGGRTDKACLIIGVDGRINHWTVAHSVNRRTGTVGVVDGNMSQLRGASVPRSNASEAALAASSYLVAQNCWMVWSETR